MRYIVWFVIGFTVSPAANAASIYCRAEAQAFVEACETQVNAALASVSQTHQDRRNDSKWLEANNTKILTQMSALFACKRELTESRLQYSDSSIPLLMEIQSSKDVNPAVKDLFDKDPNQIAQLATRFENFLRTNPFNEVVMNCLRISSPDGINEEFISKHFPEVGRRGAELDQCHKDIFDALKRNSP